MTTTTPKEYIDALRVLNELQEATRRCRNLQSRVSREMGNWRLKTGTFTPMSMCKSYPAWQEAKRMRDMLRQLHGV